MTADDAAQQNVPAPATEAPSVFLHPVSATIGTVRTVEPKAAADPDVVDDGDADDAEAVHPVVLQAELTEHTQTAVCAELGATAVDGLLAELGQYTTPELVDRVRTVVHAGGIDEAQLHSLVHNARLEWVEHQRAS